MRNRLLLSITLLSLMALTFACGGGAANTNTTNVARNTAVNSTNTSNTIANSATNTTSNSTTNSGANKAATNTAANKPVAANSTANTAGNKVATTQKPPKGATAVCKDGTYSFSKTDSGQCSGHGGVDKKL